MILEEKQSRYKELEGKLRITAFGFSEINLFTDVVSVDEYIERKDPFYSEFVVLPDGRVLSANPSHSAVMDSLLNFVFGEEFILSPTWLVEERLFYTGAIQCWQEMQFGFSSPTNEQKNTLERLEELGIIVFSYGCFDKEKQDFFLSRKDEIHDQAIEWSKKMEQKS